ncbi:DUF547 domain-containing protein [Winogradskyella sp. PG-2]|uniref:DUF547 domain-containing protein n=1 Tax=Winogradskyella sp. PG-2 TaxID=754409 RepID=UPI000458966D|nr:DUF547 domain-containing protein [Winogradskyella sp. PG-2]BAO76056.1 uncharacterized protein DUF547 [Winogradskyella sp. PG-2]
MKSVLILVLAIFVISCFGTKKAIETQPQQIKEIAVVEEVPDAIKPPIDSASIPQKTEEITQEQSEIIEEEPIVEHDTTFESFSHIIWQELLEKHASENGNVNYSGFKKDAKQLKSYINSLTLKTPTNEWSKEDKLAYWINAYNALTIDLIIRNYPTKSIKNIKDPWDQRLWKFGGKWQNLNDIEHKILRKMNEPRIHFAIVCASESCPKLQNEAFTSSNFEEQLTNVTKEFLSDTSKNELSKDRIMLSKIFKWFKKDFEENGSLIDFLNQYSEIRISNKAKRSFKAYNWDLNE